MNRNPSKILVPDWRRQLKVASSMQRPDDAAMAKAFLDQAYTHVATKAGRLMEPQFRLGAEIVKRNDEGTRMLGVFAFRVARELLYVPVFFLQSQIKGTDLLYRYTVKKFTANNPEWADFLIDQIIQDQGSSMDPSTVGKFPTPIRMDRMVMPPLSTKMGSEIENDPAAWDEILDAWSTIPRDTPLCLNTVLTKAAGAMEKMAEWIETSPKFADLLLRTFPEEHFIVTPEAATEKQAGEELLPELILHTGPEDIRGQDAVAEFFKKGYYIEDLRQEKSAIEVELRGENIDEAARPGKYEVLMPDGSFVEAAVGFRGPLKETGCTTVPRPIGGTRMQKTKPPLCALNLDTLKAITPEFSDDKPRIFGHEDPDVLLNGFVTMGSPITEMSGGKLVILLSPDGRLRGPGYVHSVSNAEGEIKIFKVQIQPGNYSEVVDLLFNPATKGYNAEDCTAGGDCRFIELKTPVKTVEASSCCPSPVHPGLARKDWEVESFEVGSPRTVHDWMTRMLPVKGAMVEKDPLGFTLAVGGEKSVRMRRGNMAVKLARDLGLDARVVEDILDRAETQGKTQFGVLFQRDEQVKQASLMRMINNPIFDVDQDAIFNVPIDTPQVRFLDGLRQPVHVDSPRLRDALHPAGRGQTLARNEASVPEEMLFNAAPEELAQWAADKKLPHILDHAAVGMLANTYDSSALLNTLLPDLERGVDATARIIFLMLWKPADFQMLYGSDDMQNLEIKLVSVFKSQAEILLDLLKKTSSSQDLATGSAVNI